MAKTQNLNKSEVFENLPLPRNPFVEDFILEFSKDSIPDHVLHQGKRCLLDLIGVLAAGSTTPMGQIITTHASRHFASGEGGITLLADGRLASPAGVALAGGVMIDSIDAHDGMRLTKGHAGCGIMPALFALLEYRGRPYQDDDLLTNLILGYEISIRAGIALHQSACDYHTSGAWVAVGTAAMAGRVLGFDQDTLAHAMGIAEYHGPRSQMMRTIDHPSMVKDGSGWGAMAG
ncbi:MAG: MmgE/PrpD family protein, partial [Alphaproteobacteria bacterium]|nr:MmgE/PrpD family protein [Alphaproteobacteria bacterium]